MARPSPSGPPPQPDGERAADSPAPQPSGASSTYGAVTVTAMVKDDGRALILYTATNERA